MLSTLLLLSSFTEFMAQQLRSQVDAGLNHQPEQQLVEYQGCAIQFVHQYWRIQPDSVCADRQGQPDFALCRQQAQSLFAASCQQLSSAGAETDESPQRAMYCAAAKPQDGTPTPAVSAAEPGALPARPTVDLQQGGRDCHRLQFKAMLSDDPQLRAERDRVCAQAPDPSNKPQ